MRGRFWKSAQSLPHILISGWSGPYEYTHTPTPVHIQVHTHTCTHEPSPSRMDATHLSVDGAQVTKWVPGRTSHLADECPCICASIQICISVLPLPCIWSARSSK